MTHDLSDGLDAAARLGEEHLLPPAVFLDELARRRRARRRVRLAAAGLPVVAFMAATAVMGPRVLDREGTTGSVAVGPGPTSPAAACVYRPEVNGPSEKPPANGLPPATPPSAPGTLTLTTNRGPITIRLDAAGAPCAVNSLVHLATGGFYDGTTCHRVTTRRIFVVQCGDPEANGTGGPGYRYVAENLDGAVYSAGTVAVANHGPDTNGSQFFIAYADNPTDVLTPNYTVLGTVTDGLDILRQVADAGVVPDGDGKPKLPLQITSVR